MLYANYLSAEIIGTPPYKSIDIITTSTAEHFDMVQDNNNAVFVAYEKGIKIYNGSEWQVVEMPFSENIRTLFYDNKDRVYFGGTDIKGYLKMDEFGEYTYTIISPENEQEPSEDIWDIKVCNNYIYFQGVHEIFSFHPDDQSTKKWNFKEKLGAMVCINNELILQNREKGLLKLQMDDWEHSGVELANNALIYKLEKTDNNTVFILSDSEEWRIIKNSQVFSLDFSAQLPNLDNYVAIESLSDEKFVLGTNNGLLTFIDTKSMEAESFQMTNEWISKIVKTKDNGLLVLTEFEIYYLEWPSPIRIQGRESGLASSIFDVTQWNDKLHISSSAGVFLEEKNQLIYQHQLFKRLNWTNKEAWKLLPINNNQALLAESHRIFLIGVDGETIKPISDMIYPRALIPSHYDPNVIYIITEFDVQVLERVNSETWQIEKILDYRPISLIEQNQSTLLTSTIGQGLNRITIDLTEKKAVEESNVSAEMGLSPENNDNLQFLRTIDNEIYAYNNQNIHKLSDGHFIKDSLFGLYLIFTGEDLQELFQNSDGLIYGYTSTKLVYLDNQNKWQLVDISNYIKGSITSIKAIDNEIKIASHGSVITYLTNLKTFQTPAQFDLIITKATFKNDYIENKLPINPQQIFSFEQDTGEIAFSFVLTDLMNQDKTQYSYRLLGTDQTLLSPVDKTHVSFDKLAAGEYSFEVRARDYLNQAYTSKAYKFIVKPHWYLTLYAKIIWIILFILAITLLLQLLIKWREKVHEIQKLELRQIIREKTAALKQANDSLQKMAHRDGLTGLFNRLYLDEFIQDLTNKDINKVIVIMLDMDCFKKYNDNNGHVAGDELLKKLAVYLQNTMTKSTDIVARYGGEEFIAILLNTDMSDALAQSEKIRKLVENKQNKTSISIGISASKEKAELKNSENIYHLIDQADKALYQAKRSGRNKIVIYDSEKHN